MIVEKLLESLQKDQELINHDFIQKYTELDKRLTDLEQCPINDIRQCQPLKSYDDQMLDFGRVLIKMMKENYSEEHKKEIPKPEYDPNDVKFKYHCEVKKYIPGKETIKINYELAKKGTFEWALIQMKNGKKVTRTERYKSNLSIFLKDELLYFKYPDQKTNPFHHEMLEEGIMGIDWELCE